MGGWVADHQGVRRRYSVGQFWIFNRKTTLSASGWRAVTAPQWVSVANREADRRP
jgi:hypothetical protein